MTKSSGPSSIRNAARGARPGGGARTHDGTAVHAVSFPPDLPPPRFAHSEQEIASAHLDGVAVTAVIWTAILTTVAVFDAWKYFLWLHLIPAWLAANMQSFRKYVEHVGLTGSTVNSSTRSIVAEGWVATFVNFTLLHEPYHGVHHWRSGLPHPELPGHAAALEPKVEEERPPFRTFGAAVYVICSSILPTRG